MEDGEVVKLGNREGEKLVIEAWIWDKKGRTEKHTSSSSAMRQRRAFALRVGGVATPGLGQRFGDCCHCVWWLVDGCCLADVGG